MQSLSPALQKTVQLLRPTSLQDAYTKALEAEKIVETEDDTSVSVVTEFPNRETLDTQERISILRSAGFTPPTNPLDVACFEKWSPPSSPRSG